VILLGLGYTSSRLTRRLLLRGLPVFAVVRQPDRFEPLAAAGLRISGFSAAELPKSAVLVHTVPPLADAETAAIRRFILEMTPQRVVYVSATTVYGDQTNVNAATGIDVSSDKGRRRMEEENWLRAGPWSTLIVRPAAIYGPDRGVHVRLKEGRLPRGSGLVSRIHVDDLAAVLEAGVLSDLTGAWPVADDRPCPSEEISSWCARLLRLPARPDAATFPVAGRAVDGREIRRLLGVNLSYPDYQAGTLASLASEHARTSEPSRAVPESGS
jgi:nucleoside-diphosphate-sugar epimerase